MEEWCPLFSIHRLLANRFPDQYPSLSTLTLYYVHRKAWQLEVSCYKNGESSKLMLLPWLPVNRDGQS